MSTFINIWVSKKSLLLYCFLIAMVPLAIPDHPVRIPFTFFAHANPQHLVSLGIAALSVPQLTSPAEILETTYPNSPRRKFYASWVALLGGTTLMLLWVSGLFSGVSAVDLALLSRNFLLGFGIILVSQHFLPPSTSWLPLLLYTASAWLFGTVNDGSDLPHWWALPLHQLHSPSASITSIVLLSTGILLFLTPRVSHRGL